MLGFEIKTGIPMKGKSVCPIIKRAFGLKKSMRKQDVYDILDDFIKTNIMPENVAGAIKEEK